MSRDPPTPIITGTRSRSRCASMNRSCFGFPNDAQDVGVHRGDVVEDLVVDR
jgi:hypothetical protein